MRLGCPPDPFIEFVAERERYVGGGVADEVWATLNVSLGEFGAAVVCSCVARPDWERFLTQLAALEASRRGEALLASVFPGEFSLRVHASDVLGHMALTGSLRPPQAPTLAELRFSGIPFEPSLLPTLLRELREAAA